MAKRIWNIDITTWAEYMDVWCDIELKEQIKNIEGVVRVLRDNLHSHFHVHYDARYNLDDIVTEMRELADEEEQILDVESTLEELVDRGFVESV